MKIETQKRDDHQLKVTAEFEPSSLDSYKIKAAKQISRESKIPGFRPGKAPLSVVRRIYGDEHIQNHAIELMIDDIYPKVIDEAKITPSGPGSLDEVISQDPPKFSFIIPLEPEIDLAKYASIRLDYHEPKVDEKEVEKTIQNFQRMFATAEPVERPAQDGDMVYLKISGTSTSPSEGEDSTIIKETPTQIWIGNDPDQENPFPYKGFDKELIGLSASQEKTIIHRFPKDSPFENLKDKEVSFQISVQSVKTMKLPVLDDAFAKTMGDFASLEALRDSIRKRIEINSREEYDRDYYDQILDKIIVQSKIKYPPQILEDEKRHVLEHLQQDLAEQKMDLDTYLKLNNKEKEKYFEEEITPIAKKRLERSLVLDEIAKKENIQLSKEEVSQEFNQTLSEMQPSKEFQKLNRKTSPQRVANAVAIQAATRLMSRRVLERLKAIATGKAENKTTAKKNSEKKSASLKSKTATDPKVKAVKTKKEKNI